MLSFTMRYDQLYRALATVVGIGPKRTIIRLDNETLHVKHGWMFSIDVPVKDIASARRMPGRPLAWGIHPMGDAWMVNGSRDGIVELKFNHPVTSKTVQMLSSTWGEVRCLYLSLTDPDGFVAAVQSET